MKYLSLLLVAILFTACGGVQQQKYEEIPWLSIEEVQEKVKKEPRKILVDVYTSWCGPCKMMMRTTFKDPDLINYISNNYYAVKFNGESGESINFKGTQYHNPNYNAQTPDNRRNSQHQFTQFLGLRGYPTLFFFDPELNKITESVGMKSADQLMEILKKLEAG